MIVEQLRESALSNGAPVLVKSGGLHGAANCEAARQHLGQGGYNLALNNCEHAADRMTGGLGRSLQVEATASILTPVIANGLTQFAKTGDIVEGLQSATASLPKSAAAYGTYRVVQSAGENLARSATSGAAQGIGRVLSRSNIAGAVATLLIEALSNTIQYLTNRISGLEWTHRLVENGARVCGGLGGAYAGAALGSLIFPGLGTALGAIFGAIFGGWTASWAAGQMARSYRPRFAY
jgi:hypothetical protein